MTQQHDLIATKDAEIHRLMEACQAWRDELEHHQQRGSREEQRLQAALTAAAERETKLREENERLRREADCHVSAESALETLARAETAEAEVERLMGALVEFNKFVGAYIAYPHNGSEISQGRQSGLIDVRDKLVALGLTPDPPRADR